MHDHGERLHDDVELQGGGGSVEEETDESQTIANGGVMGTSHIKATLTDGGVLTDCTYAYTWTKK